MSRRPRKFDDTNIPKGENGKPDFSAFGEIVELPKAENKPLDFSNYGTPVELDKISPTFLPEQDGDIVFGKDGRPIGVYAADVTPKRTWRDMPLADDMSFGRDAPIVVPASSPANNGPTANFRQRLIQSESSGRSDAEITIADGRRFVGQLQFGQARLRDYQRATGTSFTQDQFVADEALQARVAD